MRKIRLLTIFMLLMVILVLKVNTVYADTGPKPTLKG